ncbi:hypothetical protein WJX72_006419 [[Myrmecia] bisecta]|uniref:Uncharacterized protein n=1 Tax=[Myrmecia] bisecta TaxID=41462 RepID=A0AAW1QQY2_9CHLO
MDPASSTRGGAGGWRSMAAAAAAARSAPRSGVINPVLLQAIQAAAKAVQQGRELHEQGVTSADTHIIYSEEHALRHIHREEVEEPPPVLLDIKTTKKRGGRYDFSMREFEDKTKASVEDQDTTPQAEDKVTELPTSLRLPDLPPVPQVQAVQEPPQAEPEPARGSTTPPAEPKSPKSKRGQAKVKAKATKRRSMGDLTRTREPRVAVLVRTLTQARPTREVSSSGQADDDASPWEKWIAERTDRSSKLKHLWLMGNSKDPNCHQGPEPGTLDWYHWLARRIAGEGMDCIWKYGATPASWAQFQAHVRAHPEDWMGPWQRSPEGKWEPHWHGLTENFDTFNLGPYIDGSSNILTRSASSGGDWRYWSTTGRVFTDEAEGFGGLQPESSSDHERSEPGRGNSRRSLVVSRESGKGDNLSRTQSLRRVTETGKLRIAFGRVVNEAEVPPPRPLRRQLTLGMAPKLSISSAAGTLQRIRRRSKSGSEGGAGSAVQARLPLAQANIAKKAATSKSRRGQP